MIKDNVAYIINNPYDISATKIREQLKTKKKMNKEEMIEIILAYHKELKENYEENRDSFGHAHKSTDRAISKWLVMEELLIQLDLEV